MKLTYDLKCGYVARANTEFNEITGLPGSPFFAGWKSTDEIHSDIKLWMENTDNEYITIDTHQGLNKLRIQCVNNWPTYWTNSIHVTETAFGNTWMEVKRELWDIIYKLAINPETIPAVKEWNEMSRIYAEKLRKNAKSKEKMEMAEVDFDGSLTEQQIKNQYSDYCVIFLRTKIDFHSKIGQYIDGSPVWKKEPDWSINIRPVNKDIMDYYNHKCIYNKKKFEELMSKWSKYNAFDKET